MGTSTEAAIGDDQQVDISNFGFEVAQPAPEQT